MRGKEPSEKGEVTLDTGLVTSSTAVMVYCGHAMHWMMAVRPDPSLSSLRGLRQKGRRQHNGKGPGASPRWSARRGPWR